MTLTELRYVVAVAREGHFGRAAKACFVSQPTLSLGIKKLEDQLGVLIFERGQKDIVITPVGKKIIEQTKLALKEVKGIKELALSANNPLHVPLRIGAIYTIGPYLFPALLPVIRKNSPKLPLIIEE
ncbi:MAG: LysR family transcriptional regulator, partial [Gammaproteobacteria bacterium]|nr:LysR family transcriptional regulator [Gammaproteobacteria bacterium]